MTPEEFRRLGHRLVDWVADYRSRIETLPVMSRSQPGEIRAAFPRRRRSREAGSRPRCELDRTSSRHHPLEPPGLLRLLPEQLRSVGRAGRPRLLGPRRPGHELADEPGRHRARRGGDGVAAAGAGPSRGLHRRHPRHGVDGDALRAALRPGEGVRPLAAAGGSGEPAPLVVYASDQAHSSVGKAALLAGYGRDNLRLLPTDDAYALSLERLRRPSSRTSRRDAGRPRSWPPSVRPRRRPSIRWWPSRACRQHGSGSTWTRPWPGRPWSARRTARCGTASSRPTASSSTRTSGWAPASTCRPTSCATSSTSSA